MASILNKADKQLLLFIEGSSFSPTITLIVFILLILIFCFILAYKTGVSELPSNYYKQAYKYNKESRAINKSNEEIEKSIKELKKDLKHSTIKLYKNKLRFERQAYSLLSKELTKEGYNKEIDSLADKAIDIVSEADNVIDKVTDENIFNDPYGSEGL